MQHEVAHQQGPTRRGFVAGVATGAAAQAVVLGLPSGVARAAAAPKPCAPTPPGVRVGAVAVAPGGRELWTADTGATTITAHRVRDLRRGRSIDVGATPVGIAIAPAGDLALVTTAHFDRPGLVLVDLATGATDRVDVGDEPGAVAFDRSGRRAYVVSGGATGTLTRVDPRTGAVHTPIPVGAQPRGLAVLPDGRHALLALNAESAVAVVDLRRGRVSRRIATAPFPTQVAVDRQGSRGLVTHGGLGARHVTPLDLERWRAGRRRPVGPQPAGIAFDGAGRLALVACAGDGTVVTLDTRTGRRRRVRAGGAPRFVAAVGGQGVAADGDSGRLTAFRLRRAR